MTKKDILKAIAESTSIHYATMGHQDESRMDKIEADHRDIANSLRKLNNIDQMLRTIAAKQTEIAECAMALEIVAEDHKAAVDAINGLRQIVARMCEDNRQLKRDNERLRSEIKNLKNTVKALQVENK